MKSYFKYALDLPKNAATLGIIEYDLVPFNVVDNESETILLTGDKFVSLDDYRDSQGANCDSALEEQTKGITITLISYFYLLKDK